MTSSDDFDIAGGIGGDQHPRRGAERSTPFWSTDGRYVFSISAEEGRANLKRIDTETGRLDSEADFKARSPLHIAEKIHTPILFIEREANLRTPPPPVARRSSEP